MPSDIVKISESGLTDYQSLCDLQDAGYDGFLIGESLMRKDNIGAALLQVRGQV